MKRRSAMPLLVRLVVAASITALADCFSDRPATGPAAPGSGSDVRIDNFAFVPASLSVPTGTTVTWTNEDAIQHTVSSDDGTTFDSGAFSQGKTFEFTAGPPGTYTYFCRIHPFMKATLTVSP
jgi:plastocyanin